MLNIFTGKEVALSVNDDKRIQMSGGIISYPICFRVRDNIKEELIEIKEKSTQ